MRHIYLDHNATTPIAPSVQEAMLPFLTVHFGNPSSGHALGRACHEAISDARDKLAALLVCDPDEVVFTSGGTESNNAALMGILMRRRPEEGGHLVISAFEHPAITQPAAFLQRLGYELTIVPCNSEGVVEPEVVEDALRPNTALVSIMHANNEIGTIQPLRQIADICHRRNVLLHTDAAQSVGKIRAAVADLGVDLLTVAGHKMYAPKGVGALYIRHGVIPEPFMHGAGHEGGLRAGTENVPYIVGLGQAAHLMHKALDESAVRLAGLRDKLYEQLQAGLPVKLAVNGAGAERLPNTLSVNFPNVIGSDLLARIPELCASTGAACHSGVTRMSDTLAAIGLDPDLARGTVRLSVGWSTSEEEIERAASLLLGAWEDMERQGGATA